MKLAHAGWNEFRNDTTCKNGHNAVSDRFVFTTLCKVAQLMGHDLATL